MSPKPKPPKDPPNPNEYNDKAYLKAGDKLDKAIVEHWEAGATITDIIDSIEYSLCKLFGEEIGWDVNIKPVNPDTSNTF